VDNSALTNNKEQQEGCKDVQQKLAIEKITLEWPALLTYCCYSNFTFFIKAHMACTQSLSHAGSCMS
jgi:hypothetical protein